MIIFSVTQKKRSPRAVTPEASDSSQTYTKGEITMNGSSQPPCGQPNLLDIAKLVDAASRLTWCTGQMADDENRPAFCAVSARLSLHAYCVRLAAGIGVNTANPLDEELMRDMEIANVDPGAPLEELLDQYISCQLAGASAALSALEFVYQDDGGACSQRIGSALYVAIHWIECAKRTIKEELQAA